MEWVEKKKPQSRLISQLLLFRRFSALQIGAVPAGHRFFGLMFLARLVIYIHIFADWQSIGHARCIWPFPGSNLVRTAYGNGFLGSRPLSAHKGDICIYTFIFEYSYVRYIQTSGAWL